ncbi:riboflavin synthase [Candidatus Woesearchaeota archaeon]|nr:riboflavin synthase [Candidatus Woesearchaeota archaeon]
MRIGIADTTFAQVDMAKFAIEAIRKADKSMQIERYTVPGFKDLPVAAKKLLEDYKCDIALAFGWAGPTELDEKCALEANIALMHTELAANKHILKVFVFASESKEISELISIAKDRSEKHALNALALLKGKEELTPFAGKGLRQGSKHRGSLE